MSPVTSLRDYLACLEGFLRDLRLQQPPILICHSMGGLLACQLAARTTPLALVLLTPAPPWSINAIRRLVYVAGCGEDRLTPAASVRKVAALFPRATTRHYAQRGHWVIDDEETDEMMHSICGWLRPLELRAARQTPAAAQ